MDVQNNQPEIKFSAKKFNLILAIIFLSIAFYIELGLAINAISKQTYNDTITWVMGTIVFVGFPALLGGCALYTYCRDNKRIRKGLQKYGETKLIHHIRTSSITIYKNPRRDTFVYFTNQLVADPKETIFNYHEISLMYKRTATTNGITRNFLNFDLYDGSQWSICEGIEDAMIQNFMQLCIQHNPNIMLGYTKENLTKQKQRVKDFKNGKFTIPDPTL